MDVTRCEVAKSPIRIGTAGWALPRQVRDRFGGEGTNLEKYSRVLNAVEINSAFYRHHGASTYAKWASQTPDGFRFAVKLYRGFTHEAKLRETGPELSETIETLENLGEKFGALLVQLPPKLEFDRAVARRFFRELAVLTDVQVVLEPRHVSWSKEPALDVLEEFAIAKVRSDPERVSLEPERRERVEPLLYYRLHGSPVVYRSPYSLSRLEGLERRIHTSGKEAWVLFDNTTLGHATRNALELQAILGRTLENNPGSSTARTAKTLHP